LKEGSHNDLSGTTAFGTPSVTPAFGMPSTPAFGAPSSTPAFGTPSTPAFGAPLALPWFPQQQQQQQLSPSPLLLGGPITTQMAPVAPLPHSLPDRDIQVMELRCFYYPMTLIVFNVFTI
jgi:nuclear pore complex protein Nup54